MGCNYTCSHGKVRQVTRDDDDDNGYVSDPEKGHNASVPSWGGFLGLFRDKLLTHPQAHTTTPFPQACLVDKARALCDRYIL